MKNDARTTHEGPRVEAGVEMAYLVAVAGKGGAGKTTLAACFVRLLLDRKLTPVLAVDADPNSSLAPLVGLEPGPTISDIRQEMMEEKARTTGIPKERLLEMKLETCLQESAGFDLLTMGRPEGADCYCYVNNLLRGALLRLRENYRMTVVDNEAGMEHLSRMNTNDIDCLMLVCEPTMVGARSAVRICRLAETLPVRVRRKVLVWNKVQPSGVPGQPADLVRNESMDETVSLPFDERIAQLAVLERSVLTLPSLPTPFSGLADACLDGLRSAT
jgi:CO dehydrogenase maturation factor